MDHALTLDVKAHARGLGFDLVGITTADPLPEDGARMAQWVAAGMHGEMDYMSRHMPTAAHPAHVAAGARSIVVVGLAYHWDASEPPSGSLRGRISSYARGTDYHEVMARRLAELSRFLIGRGAGLARYYVDTGPLLDRAVAHRAGLGWFGKNTMLITKAGYGSYVFLGEVLTDLELQPDQPAEGSCGRCRLCLDQCPTGAIERAKRQGLRRNAAVALGNLRDARAVPSLARALDDDDPLIRGHAAWALGRIADPQAAGVLRARLARESNPPVREEIEFALAG